MTVPPEKIEQGVAALAREVAGGAHQGVQVACGQGGGALVHQQQAGACLPGLGEDACQLHLRPLSAGQAVQAQTGQVGRSGLG